MLLGLRTAQIIHWSPFKKLGSIATSHFPCGNSSISTVFAADIYRNQEQRRVRHASSLTSKIQASRHPEALSFSEIHHAIFGDSDLQNNKPVSPQDVTTHAPSDLLPSTRDVPSTRLDEVRAGLLQRIPSYVDTQQKVDFAALVKDLGTGGPLEVRRRRLRTYNAAIIRNMNQGHGFTKYMAVQGLKYALRARSSQGVALYLDRTKTEGFTIERSEIAGMMATFYEHLATGPFPANTLRQLLNTVSIQRSFQNEKKVLLDVTRLSKILGALRLRIQADPNLGLEGVWPIVSKLLQDELEHVQHSHATKFNTCWDTIVEDSLMVARYSGDDSALDDAWLIYKVSPLMVIVDTSRKKPLFVKVPLLKDLKGHFALSERRFLPQQVVQKSWLFSPSIPNRVIHLLVEHFINIGQPSKAWKVVQESKADRDLLSNLTWSLLLDYPQDLPTWDTGMQQVILAKYEEMISKIETAMGIEWQGGESGWHTPSRDQSDDGPFIDSFEADDLLHEVEDGQNLEASIQGHEITLTENH